VEIVGYLIATRGTASPLIKYGRYRLKLKVFLVSIFVTVFPYPAIPEVGTGKAAFIH
jgi:hypothetical protein